VWWRVVLWRVEYSPLKFDLQRRCGKVLCGVVLWGVVLCGEVLKRDDYFGSGCVIATCSFLIIVRRLFAVLDIACPTVIALSITAI